MPFAINKMLIAVADPSVRTTKAVKRGLEMAEKIGAAVELFTSVSLTGSYGDISRAESREFARALLTARQQELEAMCARLRRVMPRISCSVQLDYPAHEAIVRQALRSRADIVLIEAHKHNVFARLLLTQTDFALIRECPVPLLIVKGARPHRGGIVLAALDPWHAAGKPASLDKRIIEAARGLVEGFGGKLHSAHVYAPLMSFVTGSIGGPALPPLPLPEEKSYADTTRRRFRQVNAGYGIAPKNAHLRAGDPAYELPRLARSLKANTLVMGAVSRSALKRVFIGNTSERVLDSLNCDVLIVKPPGFRSSIRL
jgi:universal stress protein E